MLLRLGPTIYRKPQPRPKRRSASAPPVAALTLVAASYVDATWIVLSFDRAIDIASLDGNTITIDDGFSGFRYVATGDAELTSATTVRILVNGVEEITATGVHLTATVANGIVAVNDGGAWVGVSELELPFV